MAKNLVIVESPAKAKTIEKYLGTDFKVLASVGHIRKDTKVDKSTFDVTYEIDPGHKSIITELKKEAKAADKIWLATDEDREGESISWHLCEVLKLPKDTARITFHEITKPALENAIQHPRTVDMDMVSSQQARQTLDMLVGYDLSDIVRRKVPGAISAGRVQSPALRLIVEREKQIEKFESKSTFKITGEFTDSSSESILSGHGVARARRHGASAPSTSVVTSGDPLEKDFRTTFIAKGEVVIFDGFLRVYGKSKDLELPKVAKGEPVNCLELVGKQNFAKPPARYTEGSLVKKLEELGIGRPSTYASIMTAIQARKYVEKGESEGQSRDVVELHAKKGSVSRELVQEKYGANKGKLIPTPIGELVAGFLTDNFKNIVDYKFTANIEKDLDLVADAKLERVKMLRDFYGPFHDTVLVANGVERYNNARLLGHHPETGKPIYAKVGKTGGFIQLGDNEKEAGEKPRFAPLPKRKSVKTVTLEQALTQLALPALPRKLGKAPDGTELIAANGPFGPYLKGGKYNIPMKDLDPYTVTLEEALPLYQKKIDSMIADWGEIQIINGAYGPYVKGPGRRNNVKIPKDVDPKSITEAAAREMLENKPKTTRRGVRGGRKKATKKKATTKKTTKKSTKKTAKKTA